MDFYLKADN